jgi:hypothetical protein
MRIRRSSALSLLGVGVGLCLSAAAADEDVVSIRGAGIKRTLTCDGREVVATGTGHRLTLLGRCQRVTLTGTGHVVRVERLGRASISGMNNTIEWEHALEGERPRVSITGVNNSAVRVEGGRVVATPEEGEADAGRESGVAVEGDSGSVVVGPGGITIEGGKSSRRGRVTVVGDGATVSIGENGLRRTYDCAGGQAEVLGNDNQLTLRNCPKVTVSGNRNALTLEGPVRLIRVPGDDNRVNWSQGVDGQAPSVETAGSGNSITRN